MEKCFLWVRVGKLKGHPNRNECTKVRPEKTSATIAVRIPLEPNIIIQTHQKGITTDEFTQI